MAWPSLSAAAVGPVKACAFVASNPNNSSPVVNLKVLASGGAHATGTFKLQGSSVTATKPFTLNSAGLALLAFTVQKAGTTTITVNLATSPELTGNFKVAVDPATAIPKTNCTAVALSDKTAALPPAAAGSWSAKLTVAQEVPKQAVKNSAATGSFTGTLTGNSLAFKITFAKLTGPPTMAHIHLGAKGVAGPVLIWLCGLGSPDSQLVAAHPCTSSMTGTVTLTAALQKDFKEGRLYVNVHTAKNPDGEIRGQLGG
jgi:hypothetical protein